MGKKTITRKGYRMLAIVWTLAAASMAVAFVRRLAEFNLFLLLMAVLSTLLAANFWKSWRNTPPEEVSLDPFDAPPEFADNPVLFDDDPPQHNDSEENDNER